MVLSILSDLAVRAFGPVTKNRRDRERVWLNPIIHKKTCINCFNVGLGVVYTCRCSLHSPVVDEYHHKPVSHYSTADWCRV